MVPLNIGITGGAAATNATSNAANSQVLNFNPAVTLGGGTTSNSPSGNSPESSTPTTQTPTATATASPNPTPVATSGTSSSLSTGWLLIILIGGAFVLLANGGKR